MALQLDHHHDDRRPRARDDVSANAAALSARGASKGGRARAAKLDAETRREIARKAAAARWGDVNIAHHTGDLQIGDVPLACAVLDDGTRVINQAELRPWIKTFPDEFFAQIYRLQGWEYRPGTSKRTPYVGKLVNKYVYDQLPPGVLDELQRLNPRNERGNRSHRHHHRFLTADTGHPQLDQQIATVTTLMRISADRQEFEILFERAFPPPQPRLPLIIELELAAA